MLGKAPGRDESLVVKPFRILAFAQTADAAADRLSADQRPFDFETKLLLPHVSAERACRDECDETQCLSHGRPVLDSAGPMEPKRESS